MWGMSDDSILTRAQVRAWQARQHEIGKAIRALQDEAEDISRKLEAVRIIIGELPAYDASVAPSNLDLSSSPSDASTDEAGHGESFTDAVIAAVGALAPGSKPFEIRNWLRENGSTAMIRKQAERPYFYAVLMRQSASGRLIKEGERYSLPTSSPRGETGVATPAPVTTDNGKTFGGTEERPEAGGI